MEVRRYGSRLGSAEHLPVRRSGSARRGVCGLITGVFCVNLEAGKIVISTWRSRRAPTNASASKSHARSRCRYAAAAACVTAAHGIFWGVVQPVNVEMMRWPLDAIPQDWTNWRDRWEYGHAVRAGLATAALGALTLSPVCD